MKEVVCQDCQAMCCQNIAIHLTPTEVEFLKKAETDLEPVKDLLSDEERQMVDMAGVLVMESPVRGTLIFKNGVNEPSPYVLSGKCGYVGNVGGWIGCLVYKNPNRPQECNTAFEVGVERCLYFRERKNFK